MKIDINLDRPSKRKYDESLFEVYVLDYGDNYHRAENEPTSEFERAVRNIKGRYRDLSKFNEALYLYDEWMRYLAEKHGGYDLLKKKIKANVIDDYVPRKPRLKNIKQLKYLYKHKIIVSKVTDKNIINYEAANEYLEKFYPESVIDEKPITVEVIKDKEAIKISKDESDRDIHKYKSKSFASDADFLDSFFSNKNKSDKKKSGKKNKKDKKKVLLSDIMSDNYEYEIEESENAPVMSYNGLLLSAGTTKDIDMYHKLDDCGWLSYKLMKRANYSKRMTQMFKAQTKSKKKKKKKNKPSNGYEELLIDIMTDNGYDDYEDFQREMLSMTSKDVFK